MADNQKTTKPLTAKVRALFGVGDFGFTLMSNVETFFFNNFLTNVAMFTPAIALTIGTITSTIDACLSWVYGAFINSVKPMKWGRYRSWLIVLPWIVPFLFAFQFIKLSDNVAISSTLIIVAFVVSHVVWNIPWTANVTMISVMGKTPEARAQLASSRGTWNNLVNVFFSYLGLPLATVLGGFVGEQNRFAAIAFVLGIVMVVGYGIHFKISQGYEEIEDVKKPARESKTKATPGEMLRALFQNPNLIFLIIADLPKWMVRFVCSAGAIYYFRDAVGQPGMMTTYLLVSGVAAVIGAFLPNVLAKKVSSRSMFIGSVFVMAALTLIAYFAYTSVWGVIILMSLAQIAFGCAYSVTPALYADTAVYAKWKTGADSQGWVMGLQTVPLKVGIIARSIVVNAALISAAHFAAKPGENALIYFEQATAVQRQAVAAPFTLIPAICLIVGGLIFIFGYRLTREKVLQYQKEIDAREK